MGLKLPYVYLAESRKVTPMNDKKTIVSRLMLLAALAALCATAFAQNAPLTDAEVNSAIQRGMTSSDQYLIGQHSQWQQNTALAFNRYLEVPVNCNVSLDIYTASDLIASKAAAARAALKPFGIADVTPQMRENVVTAIVKTEIPDPNTALGPRVSVPTPQLATVTHVVIQGPTPKKQKNSLSSYDQPVSETHGTYSIVNGEGATLLLDEETALFKPSDIPTGKLVVTVVLSYGHATFHLKPLAKW